jgi:hypothetical protein
MFFQVTALTMRFGSHIPVFVDELVDVHVHYGLSHVMQGISSAVKAGYAANADQR